MNTFTTLIDAHTLSTLLSSEPNRLLVLDCSHELSNPSAGKQAFNAAHIPGSHFISLDDTLSGEKTGKNGRHPLPDRAKLVQAMRLLGADDDTQIIAYDNGGGMYAARLWWLMRWLGHSAVAVLDGGIQAWQAAGLPCTDKNPSAYHGTKTNRLVCPVCNKTWSALDILMQRDGINFKDAVLMLV